MVDPVGTKINGTSPGPRTRNRDSTGSLLSLWERYPTDLLSILVQAAIHRPAVPNSTQALGSGLVVLSWFDGIATGPSVLQQLFGPLRKVIAWEIDPEALLVAQHHVPDIVCRGDFLDDEPQDVAQTVRDFNTDGQVRVVFLGAPPCPDFSTIKGDDAPGSHGQEGQKFLKFAKFAREVEDLLHPIPVGYLVENVILQDRGEIDFFSSSLDCQAVLR